MTVLDVYKIEQSILKKKPQRCNLNKNLKQKIVKKKFYCITKVINH